MSNSDGYKGLQRPESGSSQFNAMAFLVERILNRIATATLVKVINCTNSGADSAVGYVDVQPLVHQLDGSGNIMPHGIIHHIPYFRLQGGANAVIIDPQPGDYGICIFAQHDISNVKASGKAAAPGSFRRYDMADGLYMGGFLNGAPNQYIAFTNAGINVVTPGKYSVQAQSIEFDAPVTMTQTATVSQDLTAAGKSVSSHTHTDPQGGNTSAPN